MFSASGEALGERSTRFGVALLLAFLLSGCGRGDGPNAATMMAQPTKIHLIPDIWHIKRVGHLRDGQQFIIDAQLSGQNGVVTDYLCTYIFDKDGNLTSHTIESLGVRSNDNAKFDAALQRQLDALGKYSVADVWVRPFVVRYNGIEFGLIPRQLDDGSWRVEFMPGNTLSFYPPWDDGGYDT